MPPPTAATVATAAIGQPHCRHRPTPAAATPLSAVYLVPSTTASAVATTCVVVQPLSPPSPRALRRCHRRRCRELSPHQIRPRGRGDPPPARPDPSQHLNFFHPHRYLLLPPKAPHGRGHCRRRVVEPSRQALASDVHTVTSTVVSCCLTGLHRRTVHSTSATARDGRQGARPNRATPRTQHLGVASPRGRPPTPRRQDPDGRVPDLAGRAPDRRRRLAVTTQSTQPPNSSPSTPAARPSRRRPKSWPGSWAPTPRLRGRRKPHRRHPCGFRVVSGGLLGRR